MSRFYDDDQTQQLSAVPILTSADEAANMQLTIAQGLDVGLARDHNEDFLFVDDADFMTADGALFVVADGVGGLGMGEVVSQLAVEQFVEAYRSAPPAK